MRVDEIPEIKKLSIPEKILFVEKLWDSISAHEHKIPVPDCHKVELDRRLASYHKNLGNLLYLDDLQSRIEAKK